MVYIDSSAKRQKVALFSTFFGAFFIFILIIMINKPIEQSQKKFSQTKQYLNMKREVKSLTKPKPKPKPKKAQKAPIPELSSLLNGIDMGIPEFGLDGIGEDSSALLGDISDQIMSASSVDVKPSLVARPNVNYPEFAKRKNLTGYVVVNLLINEEGRVETSQILESNPPSIFDASALNSVRDWRFSPALYKGAPVKVWVRQKIRFDFN
jgi:protein TonB